MTKIFLDRALRLLARYVTLCSDCHDTDKIERAKLYSDVDDLVSDIEKEQERSTI